MSLEATLVGLEREFWEAAGNRDAYGRRLAAVALHVLPGWGIVESDDILEGVAQAEPWQSYAIDEPRVVELGPDTAALVYIGSGRRANDVLYRAAIISVYVRAPEENAWLLALHQQTPIGIE